MDLERCHLFAVGPIVALIFSNIPLMICYLSVDFLSIIYVGCGRYIFGSRFGGMVSQRVAVAVSFLLISHIFSI